MLFTRRITLSVILLLLAVLTACPNFFYTPEDSLTGGHSWERYDSSLFHRIQSVSDLVTFTAERVHDASHPDKKSVIDTMSRYVRRRFYHGYSYYRYKDNWIAVVLGKYVWSDLDAIVDPDDILKHRMGACSQVSIVLMEALRQFDIPTRKVALNGHFALEAYANGHWYFLDANGEPDFRKIKGIKSLQEILAHREQYIIYQGRMSPNKITRVFSRVSYEAPDMPQAVHALLFHKITAIMSHWLWLGFSLAFLFFVTRKRTAQQLPLAGISTATEAAGPAR